MDRFLKVSQDALMEQLKKIAAITLSLATKEEKAAALREAGYTEEFITLFLQF